MPRRPTRKTKRVGVARKTPARNSWFTIDGATELARVTLAHAPHKKHSRRRANPAGDLVWDCVLPAELCPGLNRYAELVGWQRQRLKNQALSIMRIQLMRVGLNEFGGPLPGRPEVHCVRFSSRAPDIEAGWSKIPVDRLTGQNRGLNFIEDDRPSCIDLHSWWEFSPPGKRFVYVAIYTGAEET